MCSNCHTMHNSQGSVPMARGNMGWDETGESWTTDPTPQLLVASCFGCHSSTGSSAVYEPGDGSKIPIVFNTGGYPSDALAGGNFYYVSVAGGSDDRKGHNIFFENPDESLTHAPGDTTGCLANNSCHANLHRQYTGNPPDMRKYGCESCHFDPKHHANDHDHLQGGKVEACHRKRFWRASPGSTVEGFGRSS